MVATFFVPAHATTMLGSCDGGPPWPGPRRTRGSHSWNDRKVEGDTYIVKARDGAELKLKLAPNAAVVALVQASAADIKQGSYIGIAGMPQADGSQKALEVHIFPEAMRGVGDGHRGWDLQSSSTMTNGNVEADRGCERRSAVTLKYKDGEKKIAIPAGIPIVLFVPGEVERAQTRRQDFRFRRHQATRWHLAGPACQRRPRCGAADVVLGEDAAPAGWRLQCEKKRCGNAGQAWLGARPHRPDQRHWRAQSRAPAGAFSARAVRHRRMPINPHR